MARTKKRAVWIALEVDGSNNPVFGVDPSADGSGYKYVPAVVVGDLVPERKLLEAPVATGTTWATAPIPGPDGASLQLEVPLSGLASACGAGTNASSVTDDYLDLLARHIFTTAATVAGVAVGTGSTGSNLVLASDPTGYDAQQLVPIFETAKPTTGVRALWALLNNSTGPTFTAVTPAMDYSPTNAAIAYGTKTYLPSDSGGPTIALAYKLDGVIYRLLGGRVTQASIVGELDGFWRLKITISFDSKADDTSGKTALPAVTRFTRFQKVLLSPFWFNGTKYSTRKIEIDLAITAAVVGATDAVNGRAGHESIAMGPKVMVEPQFAETWNTLRDAQTEGRVLVQFGSGALSGGVLNAGAFHIEAATVRDAKLADENGRQRHAIMLETVTSLTHTSGDASRVCQYVRA